jgi:hypothetical protein
LTTPASSPRASPRPRSATIGRAGPDALRSLADAYRAYARSHPGREAASVRAPAPGDEAHDAASDAALRVLLAVLAGYGITYARLVDTLDAGLRALAT